MSLEELVEKSVGRSRRIAKSLLITLLVINLASVAVHYLRIGFWPELLVSYNSQLVIGTAALLLLYIALRLNIGMNRGLRELLGGSRQLVALIILALALMHNAFLPLLAPAVAERTTERAPLRAMTFNKLYNNTDYIQISNYISSRDPDILAVEEIYKNEAGRLADQLGYVQWHMAECNCSAYGSDLAIFSKFPITSVSLAFEDRLGGVMRAELDYDGEPLIVYVLHLVPSYSGLQYSLRSTMYQQLATAINDETAPTILMGDFNTSPQTIDFRSFAAATEEKIRPVLDRPLPRCSWFGASSVLCARIDHVFIPGSSHYGNYRIGPSLGSDHRPIEVDIRL